MKRKLSILLLFYVVFFRSQTVPKITIKDENGNTSSFFSCAHPTTGTLNLHADYPELKKTNSYESKKNAAYNPYSFTTGTRQNVYSSNYNNKFFKSVDIGFDFCFYGGKYSKVVLGSNGVVSFDQSILGQIIFYQFSQQIPNKLMPTNSIFGAFQEGLYFDGNNGADVYTELVGTAPFRKFVITYYNGLLLYNGTSPNCDKKRSTTQIVLNETTNVVDVNIDQKPLACSDSNFQNAVVGMQDGDAVSAVFPANRNTGAWSATKESYSFYPNAASIIPTISWYDSGGTKLGTGDAITVNITKSETFTAVASYDVCDNNAEFSSNYPVVLDPDYALAKDDTEIFCIKGSTVNFSNYYAKLTNQNPINFNFEFYKTNAEAISGVGTKYTSTVLNTSEKYYVRMISKKYPSCFSNSVLTLNLITDYLLKTSIDICEAAQKNYLLEDILNLGILDPSYTGKVSFYLSPTSAAVTNANLTDGMQVWVRLDACSDLLGPITIHLLPGPVVSNPPTIQVTMCDNEADNIEIYSFTSLDMQIIPNFGNYIFHHFTTEEDAIKNNLQNEIFEVRENMNTIYVRVEDKNGGCFSIAIVHIDVTFVKVIAVDADIYICYDGISSVTISDLSTNPSYVAGMGNNTNPYKFYNSKNEALSQSNPISSVVLNAGGSFTTQPVFVRFDDGTCFTIRELIFHLVHPEPTNTLMNICDSFGDGVEKVKLSDYESYFFGSSNVTVKYFSDAGYTVPITNDSLNVTITGSNTVYVEMTSTYTFFDGGLCKARTPINFAIENPPLVSSITLNETDVCDNNGDGFEYFDATSKQNDIFSGTGVNFEYYDAYDVATNTFSSQIDDPKYIKISSSPKTIYVKITNSIGCYSKAEMNVSYVFSKDFVKLNSTKLEQCSLSNEITFNLTSAEPQMFLQSQNTINLTDLNITYYEVFDSATYTFSKPITNPSAFKTGRSAIAVYAKYTTKKGCFFVTPINLITYLSMIQEYPTENYCENDGVILADYEKDLLANIDSTANYVYTFYNADPITNSNAQVLDKNKSFYPQFNTTPNKVWYKIEIMSNNIAICSAIGFVNFVASNNNLAVISLNAINNICDTGNDGKEDHISIRQREAEVKSLFPTATIPKYYTSFPEKEIANPDDYNFDSSVQDYVYMKVSVPGFCSSLVKIPIVLNKIPIFTVDSPLYICLAKEKVSILPHYESIQQLGLTVKNYEWTLPDGTKSSEINLYDITTPGKYHIKVTTKDNCTYENDVELIAKPIPVIDKIEVEGSTATVTASGSSGIIMYSMDNISWQISNIFPNVSIGIHTFYVKYEDDDCPSVGKATLIYGTANYVITPNSDGYNDTVTIPGLYVFGGNSLFKIYDRYGKLIYAQTTDTEAKWDGYYLGRPVPTGTYWYTLTVPDGRELKGWIFAKNRD